MLHHQRGNALFLILIAVALFAALSYAITQSGRGGGTISKEQATLEAARITQLAADLRTTVTRMILSGVSPENIAFNGDNTNGINGDLTDPPCDTHPEYCVFTPEGGGGPDVAGGWYNQIGTGTSGNYIKDVGTNTDVSGRDAIVAFEVNKSSGHGGDKICEQINKGLGLANPPQVTHGCMFPDTTYNIGVNVYDGYPGEPFACSDEGDGDSYLYHHALIER